MTNFLEYPSEIKSKICSYLSIYDILKLREVFTVWKDTIDHDIYITRRLDKYHRCMMCGDCK